MEHFLLFILVCRLINKLSAQINTDFFMGEWRLDSLVEKNKLCGEAKALYLFERFLDI